MKTAKKKHPETRRMNALLQIALMQAVNVHGYSRPEVAQCYNVNALTDMASFYFDSSAGRHFGSGELSDSVWIHEDNREIIRRLVECIRQVTEYAEHNYRRQVMQSMQVALKAHPEQFSSITKCALSLI